MFIFYDLVYLLMVLFFLPGYFLKGKWHPKMGMRFGIFHRNLDWCAEGKEVIWIHAVSVGEVLAIAHIVDALKQRYPAKEIVCSTVTKTGFAIAQETLSSEVRVIFAPIDFSFVVRRHVRLLNPQLYISAETEIWPNLFGVLKKKNVPIIIINGRISDRTFKNYQRAKFLLGKTIQSVSHFCMQSERDLRRILDLSAAKEKATVVGNLKFETVDLVKSYSREELGLNAGDKILLAGSTHPGENEQIVQVFLRLKKNHPELKLIIVPRHIDRVEGVLKMIGDNHLKTLKFSQFKNWEDEILVVDEMGVLRNLYAITEYVFIGKTFCVGGGQNMIEPVYMGKPTFVGPKTENFKDAMRIFLDEKVIKQVMTWEELYQGLDQVMQESAFTDFVSKNGPEVVRKHSGATGKTLTIIYQFLDRTEL